MSESTQQMVECVLKLGGSAVTVKDKLETEKPDEILQIAEFLKSHQQICILVHGAGSFGHFQAKEYGVADGYHGNTDAEQIKKVKEGFCKTRVSITKLNHIIVKELVSHGVNAVGLSPCGRWVTDNGQVVKSDMDSIKNLLAAGYLPVLHGDCVEDKVKGCTILSGDTIMEMLCAEFRPERAIFLADVNGVFDKPPSHPNSRQLPVVTVTPDGNLCATIATMTQEHDVTGGIEKKLRSASSIAIEGKGLTKVFVCGINTPAAHNVFTQGSLKGEEGTEIRLKEN